VLRHGPNGAALGAGRKRLLASRVVVERYFAFGANMHPKTLERRGISALSAAPARLAGHRLVFDQPAIPLFDPVFASVCPAEDQVWGVLYELEPSALRALRAFEGGDYEEIGVTVSLSPGQNAEAWTFVTRGARPEGIPSRRYLRVMVDGARHHGLPEEWIERLAEQPSVYVPVLHDVWTLAFGLVDHVHRRSVRPARRRSGD
jgi:hypothetical protein